MLRLKRLHKREITAVELNNDNIRDQIICLDNLKTNFQGIAVGGPVSLPKNQAMYCFKMLGELAKTLELKDVVEFAKMECRKIKQCRDNFTFILTFNNQKKKILDSLDRMKATLLGETIKDLGPINQPAILPSPHEEKKETKLPPIHIRKQSHVLFHTACSAQKVKVAYPWLLVRTHRKNHLSITSVDSIVGSSKIKFRGVD